MSDVRTWYFGTYCGEILALNDFDEESINEDDGRRFVLESDYILIYNELIKLKRLMKIN